MKNIITGINAIATIDKARADFNAIKKALTAIITAEASTEKERADAAQEIITAQDERDKIITAAKSRLEGVIGNSKSRTGKQYVQGAINDLAYYSYVLAWNTGNVFKTGVYEIKPATKTPSVTAQVNTPFAQVIADILKDIGVIENEGAEITGAGSKKFVGKIASKVMIRISGSKKVKIEKGLISPLNMVTWKEMLLRAVGAIMLEYGLIVKTKSGLVKTAPKKQDKKQG